MLDCIVIGAGLSGLTAAHRLKQVGASVRILEARASPGGRVKTVLVPHHSTFVELGGEWIGSYHTALRKLCEEVGLTLTGSSNGERSGLLPSHVRIRRTRLDVSQIEALERELSFVVDDLVSLSRSVDPLAPWNAPREIARLTSVSVDAWLRERRCSFDLQELFTDLAPNSQSMLALLALVAGGEGYPFFYESEVHRIAEGTTNLVSALHDRLSDSLELSVECRAVSRSNNTGVLITSLEIDGTRVDHMASTLVLAIPFPCLNTIQGVPVCPISYPPSMCCNQKVTVFVSPICLADFQPTSILTDEVYRIVQSDVAESLTLPPCARVDVFVRPLSDSHSPMTDACLAEVLQLCALSPSSVIAIHQSDWSAQPFSLGSYAVLGPNTLQKDYQCFLDGSPPFFFAGDYVLPGFAGYMEGAVRSGELAARRVVAYLS
jgi:monoamine oxidase